MSTHVLVTGAGGFIGHHLLKYLVKKGYWVRGVDIKYPEYEDSPAQEFELLDLRRYDNCLIATRNIEKVYNLAADIDRKSTRLNSSHIQKSRMPSSA